MVHSEVYLNKYVVSRSLHLPALIALKILHKHRKLLFFQGGSADPICPMCGRTWLRVTDRRPSSVELKVMAAYRRVYDSRHL